MDTPIVSVDTPQGAADDNGNELRALLSQPSEQPTPTPEPVAEPSQPSAERSEKRAPDATTDSTTSPKPGDKQPEPSPATSSADDDPEAPGLSKYERDKRRLARNRREFEEEKSADRKWREEARAEIENLRRGVAAVRPATAVGGQLTAKDFAEHVPKFEADATKAEAQAREAITSGDAEGAMKALDAAANARTLAQRAGEQARTLGQQELESSWKQNAMALIEQYPVLKDATGPIGKRIQETLDHNPVLGQLPNGFFIAAQWVNTNMLAEKVPGLEKTVAELTKENADLKKYKAEREGLAAGVPGVSGIVPSGRKEDDMSLDELETTLRSGLESRDYGRAA